MTVPSLEQLQGLTYFLGEGVNIAMDKKAERGVWGQLLFPVVGGRLLQQGSHPAFQSRGGYRLENHTKLNKAQASVSASASSHLLTQHDCI